MRSAHLHQTQPGLVPREPVPTNTDQSDTFPNRGTLDGFRQRRETEDALNDPRPEPHRPTPAPGETTRLEPMACYRGGSLSLVRTRNGRRFLLERPNSEEGPTSVAPRVSPTMRVRADIDALFSSDQELASVLEACRGPSSAIEGYLSDQLMRS